jgi:hypothetical protein
VTVEYTCNSSVFLFCFSGLQNSNLWQIHQIQNMNHKPQSLPRFTTLAAMAGFALGAACLTGLIPASPADEAQPPAATATPDAPAADQTPAADVPQDTPAEAAASGLPAADEILTQLRAKLDGLSSLKCDLHQTSLLAGMKLTASGKYTEASGNRVSLQYVIFPMVAEKSDDAKALALNAEPVAEDETKNRGVLLQISDGTILSTSWKNGENVRITRRNVKDILAAAQATTTYDPKNAAMDLGVGGLRGLISRLQTTMEFAPVKLIKAGDRDVYEVTGRWSEKIRKEVFKVPENTIIDPRPQVPEYVRVFVDVQTMLPRRIQFLKRSMNPTEKMVRPMITLDLRNVVLNEAIPDETFIFKAPENTPEEDQTEQIIQMIQQSLQPTSATPTPTPEPVVKPQ